MEIETRSNQFLTKKLRKVIFASSAGTIIEWYDFYIFGSLAAIIATQYFPREMQPQPYLARWPYLPPGLLCVRLVHWFLAGWAI